MCLILLPCKSMTYYTTHGVISVRKFGTTNLFYILDGKHDDYYEEQEQQRAAGEEVARGCGRAGYQTALCHHADGGTGQDAGADGEAD